MQNKWYTNQHPHKRDSMEGFLIAESPLDADIEIFEEELHSEIEKIYITEEFVDMWTYPFIQPKLIEEAQRRGIV